jgi:hypothetical protein
MAVPGEISQKKDEFGAGPEDAFLIPLVTAALALKVLGKLLVSMLINVLDFTFPLVIQLVRFPLFTARILGDTAVAVGKLAVSVLPIPEQARIDWRRGISEKWSALRPRISYGAFEEAVHHLFDDGMAWVFRKCRKLSPRQAVWLIAAAALWLPVSFGIATAMHASLLLYAAVLPAWMQLSGAACLPRCLAAGEAGSVRAEFEQRLWKVQELSSDQKDRLPLQANGTGQAGDQRCLRACMCAGRSNARFRKDVERNRQRARLAGEDFSFVFARCLLQLVPSAVNRACAEKLRGPLRRGPAVQGTKDERKGQRALSGMVDKVLGRVLRA